MEATRTLSFPVSLRWPGGKRVLAHVDGKETVEIATPPEFGSGIEGVWSPEDFLVASVASCYVVTLVAVAQRSRVPLNGIAVDAVGRVGKRDDSRFGFLDVSLRVEIDTDDAHLRAAYKTAERAERHCLVSMALAVPVHLELDVYAREPTPAGV